VPRGQRDGSLRPYPRIYRPGPHSDSNLKSQAPAALTLEPPVPTWHNRSEHDMNTSVEEMSKQSSRRILPLATFPSKLPEAKALYTVYCL
jgi:hypothetical protein